HGRELYARPHQGGGARERAQRPCRPARSRARPAAQGRCQRGFLRRDCSVPRKAGAAIRGTLMLQRWWHAVVLIAIAASPAAAAAAELEIVNSSGKAIHEFYLAAAGERGWGADRLRTKQPSMIARGETHVVAGLAPGLYQLMLVDAEGSECEIEGVEIGTTLRIDLTAKRLKECISSH